MGSEGGKCQWCPATGLGPLDFIGDDRTGERTYVCVDCANRWIRYMDGRATRTAELAALEYARCLRLPR